MYISDHNYPRHFAQAAVAAPAPTVEAPADPTPAPAPSPTQAPMPAPIPAPMHTPVPFRFPDTLPFNFPPPVSTLELSETLPRSQSRDSLRSVFSTELPTESSVVINSPSGLSPSKPRPHPRRSAMDTWDRTRLVYVSSQGPHHPSVLNRRNHGNRNTYQIIDPLQSAADSPFSTSLSPPRAPTPPRASLIFGDSTHIRAMETEICTSGQRTSLENAKKHVAPPSSSNFAMMPFPELASVPAIPSTSGPQTIANFLERVADDNTNRPSNPGNEKNPKHLSGINQPQAQRPRTTYRTVYQPKKPRLQEEQKLPMPLNVLSRQPRRIHLFREQSVMRSDNQKQTTTDPSYWDPLAIVRRNKVLAKGWLQLSVQVAPGTKYGTIAKWMFRRSFTRRFAQLRGNVVLLSLNESEPAHEIFSPVGCIVSPTNATVKRGRTTCYSMHISRDGFSLHLRFNSEVDARMWSTKLRNVSIVRQSQLSDFKVIAPIGEGASGKVFLVRDTATGCKLALKCMSKKAGVFGSEIEFRHTVDERIVHEEMRYKDFVLQMHHAVQTRDHLYIATEFCEGGDLYHLMETSGGDISEEEAQFITAQVVMGLKALHDEGILFRDLKPENVLLDHEGRVRLADFGLCKILDRCDALTRTVCGTYSYLAAELLNGGAYGISCDVWTLGTFLYHVMTGHPPRVAASLEEARENIFGARKEVIWYDGLMSENAMSLITNLIQDDPKKRMGCGPAGISELCDHPFFEGIDWARLSHGPVPDSITHKLQSSEKGSLRNFNQEEWESLCMDEDQESLAYTEGSLWPLRNLKTHPLPSDFLVSFGYSCELISEK